MQVNSITQNQTSKRFALVVFSNPGIRSRVTVEALQTKGYKVRDSRRFKDSKDVFFHGHRVATLKPLA
ncbi:hypothetical protein [Gilvimarinus chinensis]|uniref:hypothetical protein n=1 Tax=Gilvimarinus chinensis TaxID=396005 RepID=UPI00036934F4|nr:hypothetical protein [Gilvimarinus chinensis]